ncbi:MAG: PKD domain-containing protein [Anaerolineae bacterium]|nr:PKD domain-containing protein [Anaerolineae bacterium]
MARKTARFLVQGVGLGLALVLLGCAALQRNLPPQAEFLVEPETAYVGEPILFDASPSSDPDGTIVSYEWEFGDGDRDAGVTVAHAYREAGEYTVTLTVRDDRGATDTAQATVRIQPLPPDAVPPVARFTFTPQTPRVNEEIAFDASASTDDGTIEAYLWDFGDGHSAEGVRVRHRYTRAGAYWVRLEVVDDAGLVGRAAVRLTVQEVPAPNQPPQARFTFAPQSPAAGNVVQFDASSSSDPDGSIVDYRWDFGDGKRGKGVVVQHIYYVPGRYKVRLVVVDDKGAQESADAEVTVGPPVPPPPPG